MKFRVAKQPLGHAKFDVNRCNESPLQGEDTDFWPVSKFNTDSLPLRGILPVIKPADARKGLAFETNATDEYCKSAGRQSQQ